MTGWVSRSLRSRSVLEWYAAAVRYSLWYGTYLIVFTASFTVLPKDRRWYLDLVYWIPAWILVSKLVPEERRIREAGSVRPAAWIRIKGAIGITANLLTAVVTYTSVQNAGALPACLLLSNAALIGILMEKAVREVREDLVRSVLEE